jgi:Tfp pilus assembly protein PilO
MKAEAIQIQKIFHRSRELQYPAVLTLVLIGLNLLIYYGLLLPHQQRLIQQEQAWKNAREQFSQMRQQQKAQDDLKQFRNLLLAKNEFARQVVNHLSETAKRLKLNLPSVSYKPDPAQDEQLTKMNFSFAVSGSYEAIRRFIHAIETSSDFLIIEDLVLSKRSKETGSLELQLRVATYLK